MLNICDATIRFWSMENTSIGTCYSEKSDSLKFHCLFELVSFNTGANCQPFLHCLSWLLLFPMQDFYTSQWSVARLWFNKGGIGWFAGMHCRPYYYQCTTPYNGATYMIWIISFTISLYWLWLTFWFILRSSRFSWAQDGLSCWTCMLRCSELTSILLRSCVLLDDTIFVAYFHITVSV